MEKKQKQTSTKFKVLVGLSIGTAAVSTAALVTTLVVNNQLQNKISEEERTRKWYDEQYQAKIAEWTNFIQKEIDAQEKTLKFNAMSKITQAVATGIGLQPEAAIKIKQFGVAAMERLTKNNPNGTKSAAIGDIGYATIRGCASNQECEAQLTESSEKFYDAILKASTTNTQAKSLGWQGISAALIVAKEPDTYTKKIKDLKDDYINKTVEGNDVKALLYGYCVGVYNMTTYGELSGWYEDNSDKLANLYVSITRQPDVSKAILDGLDEVVYAYIDKIDTEYKAMSVGKIGAQLTAAIARQPEAAAKAIAAAKELVEQIVNQ